LIVGAIAGWLAAVLIHGLYRASLERTRT